MAEPPSVDKQDSLEDSLSSEEWTFIDKKESKSTTEETPNDEKINEPKETIVNEDACQSEESIKNEIELVEEGEEAGEKEVESDDVSILSDESEPEHVTFEEGKIERMEWQMNKKQYDLLKVISSKNLSDKALTANVIITYSVFALIFGVIIAGQIVEYHKEKSTYTTNTNIEEKLRELSGIEEKLKELSEVKQALDQLRLSVPEMKKSEDQLYQKNINYKPKFSIEDYKNIEKLNLRNILNIHSFHDIHSYDNRLEMLDATYKNFCSTINKINSTSSIISPELCKTPKILSDMIVVNKIFKQAFEQSQETDLSDKRFLTNAEKKLDDISDSLLNELSVTFSRFSTKIHERFDGFGKKLINRLCSLNKRKNNDNFLNTLFENEFIANKCHETSNTGPVVIDLKSNSTWKKEKNNENKKRYEEFKKNGYKYDNKSVKNRKNGNLKDFSREVDDEGSNNEETFNDSRSKGELKNDSNWKNNKYEQKEKYSKEEKKYEKNQNSYKNDRKSQSIHDYDNSFQKNERDFEYDRNFETKRERYYDQKFGHKKDYDSDSKFDHKKGYDSDNESNDYKKKNYQSEYKFDQNKNGYESDDEFEYKKRNHEYDQSQERYKKYNNYDKKNQDFNYKSEYNKNHRDSEHKHENKRSHNYYDEDSKYNVYLEKNENEFFKNNDEQQKFRQDKEYLIKPENFKESKYSKYEKEYKKDKYYPEGEWQMQRAKARDKRRNSDWYFVRADSRQKARIPEEEDEEEEEEERERERLKRPMRWTPTRPSPPPRKWNY